MPAPLLGPEGAQLLAELWRNSAQFSDRLSFPLQVCCHGGTAREQWNAFVHKIAKWSVFGTALRLLMLWAPLRSSSLLLPSASQVLMPTSSPQLLRLPPPSVASPAVTVAPTAAVAPVAVVSPAAAVAPVAVVSPVVVVTQAPSWRRSASWRRSSSWRLSPCRLP